MKSAFPVTFSASLFLVPVLKPVAAASNDSNDDTGHTKVRSEQVAQAVAKVCEWG